MTEEKGKEGKEAEGKKAKCTQLLDRRIQCNLFIAISAWEFRGCQEVTYYKQGPSQPGDLLSNSHPPAKLCS